MDFLNELFQKTKKIQEYYPSVKQFGPRSGTMKTSGLSLVQTVCKGYQQMKKVGGKELSPLKTELV